MCDIVMHSFDDVYKEVSEIAARFDEMRLKVEAEPDTDMARIVGPGFTPLARAKSGLADLDELVITTAEHHPYWNILYRCCQICHTLLDRWESELTGEEIDEIKWSAGMLSDICGRMMQDMNK